MLSGFVRAESVRSAPIDALRAEIAGMERRHGLCGPPGTGDAAAVLPLGLGPVDALLPGGGLARSAVHEAGGSAAGAFAAWVLRGLRGPVLWCVEDGGGTSLYGPGLAQLGIATSDLLVVRCRRQVDMLWAMEEGLKDPAPVAVVAEPAETVDLTASRRLQLAAEAGGTFGLVLGRGGRARSAAAGGTPGRLVPSALASRWRVDAAPSAGVDRPCWHLGLLRCRSLAGAEGFSWTVIWNDETGDFAVAAASGDRSAGAAERDPQPVEPLRRQAG